MKHSGQAKRRPWVVFTLVGTIITLALGVFVFISMFNGDLKNSTASATDQPEISTTVTDSEFPDIRLVQEKKSDTHMTYNANYPKTTFDHINEEINKYITTSKENYLNELKNSEVANGDLSIEVELSQFNNKLYSITFKNNVTIGDIAHNTSVQTYVFDQASGEFISLENLLNGNTTYLKVFSKYVKNQISNNYNNVNHEILLEKTTPQWDNFNRFSLDDEAFVLYFDKGEIADPTIGVTTVTIPLPFLNPILAEQFNNGKVSETTILTPYDHNTKRVALTFDDGPHASVTPQVLNLLDQYDAKATFFLLGKNVKLYPEIAKDTWNRGHEIGNHTWGHPVLTRISAEKVTEEFNSTNQAIQEVIGQNPTVFRPPYGAINSQVESMLNLPVIMWSIDTYDWKHRNPSRILTYVQNYLHNDAIVLMHDIHQTTADGLESVLSFLQQSGYIFVTVSDISLAEEVQQMQLAEQQRKEDEQNEQQVEQPVNE